MEGEIINRIAKSPLMTIDLEEYYPKGERCQYDLAQNLFQGMILREKDFRDFIKAHDWSKYKGKFINVICSEDVIIPTWAYILLVTKLQEVAAEVVVGNREQLEFLLFQRQFDQIDWSQFKDKPVVVKGCGDLAISETIFGELTRRLLPEVKSLMFGEPCSTVPIYKRPRKN